MDAWFSMASDHREALVWVSGGSIAMFVGSLLLIPWLIARAPSDVFVRALPIQRGLAALMRAVLRNLLGVVLLVVGLLMLVLPGQGLLMVLVAMTLLDVPGKRELVRRIVRKPAVWRLLNYLRARAQQPPFEQP